MSQNDSSTEEEVPVRRLQRSFTMPVESRSSQRDLRAKRLPEGAIGGVRAVYLTERKKKERRAASSSDTHLDTSYSPADYEYKRRAPVSGTSRRNEDYSEASDTEDQGQRRDRGVRFDEADQVYYARSSSSDEDDDDRYFLTRSWAPSSVTSLASDAPSTGKDGSVVSSTPVLPSVKEMRVRESKYEGDACQDGNHTAKLTLLDDAKNSQHALFKWV